MTDLNGTKSFWEDIKKDYIDANIVLESLEENERDALSDLRWASASLADNVCEFEHLLYNALADFVQNYALLATDLNWRDSDCEKKLGVIKAGQDVFGELVGEYTSLNLSNVTNFSGVFHKCSEILECKPNKYQMDRFAQHGIIWEGEVRDH